MRSDHSAAPPRQGGLIDAAAREAHHCFCQLSLARSLPSFSTASCVIARVAADRGRACLPASRERSGGSASPASRGLPANAPAHCARHARGGADQLDQQMECAPAARGTRQQRSCCCRSSLKGSCPHSVCPVLLRLQALCSHTAVLMISFNGRMM